MTAPLSTLTDSATLPRITVDIWSDIACPWCYIGKRRFEQALGQFPQAAQVDVVWHSFELDPTAPAVNPVGMRDGLAMKYGTSTDKAQGMLDSMTATAAQEGLEYHFERASLANTFQAHQVIHLAARHGLQDAMKERLLKAYMTEGETLSDTDTLVRLAGQVGLDAQEVRDALDAQTYAQAVRQDEAQARAYGIQGVPFFVLGGKYGVSGAQDPATLRGALEQVWNEIAPQPAPLQLLGTPDAADGCEDGSCAVPSLKD
ncbi:DsbA family oxidoreductase [Deinococcus aquiradiocola]|uniref:DSBA oxidoreductase n=1 Tax=Deinococcus aquiradiocola TaxID=393059 RepID=A0A917UW71_9DEIO|nr:DsbA family oxidoreductase [Deinococcus aquiradiocola]GGJ89785.1 DSBA oxidoreductase [Deinococcus aquiradiocola]